MIKLLDMTNATATVRTAAMATAVMAGDMARTAAKARTAVTARAKASAKRMWRLGNTSAVTTG